jgi:hypothetical protein
VVGAVLLYSVKKLAKSLNTICTIAIVPSFLDYGLYGKEFRRRKTSDFPCK